MLSSKNLRQHKLNKTIYEVKNLMEFPIHSYYRIIKEEEKDLLLELKLKC